MVRMVTQFHCGVVHSRYVKSENMISIPRPHLASDSNQWHLSDSREESGGEGRGRHQSSASIFHMNVLLASCQLNWLQARNTFMWNMHMAKVMIACQMSCVFMNRWTPSHKFIVHLHKCDAIMFTRQSCIEPAWWQCASTICNTSPLSMFVIYS